MIDFLKKMADIHRSDGIKSDVPRFETIAPSQQEAPAQLDTKPKRQAVKPARLPANEEAPKAGPSVMILQSAIASRIDRNAPSFHLGFNQDFTIMSDIATTNGKRTMIVGLIKNKMSTARPTPFTAGTESNLRKTKDDIHPAQHMNALLVNRTLIPVNEEFLTHFPFPLYDAERNCPHTL